VGGINANEPSRLRGPRPIAHEEETAVPKITHNRAFPHENDEFDILVGTFDEDDRGDEDDGATYGFYEKNDFYEKNEFSDVLFFNFQGGDGDDEFFGGPNGDILKGGKGIDTLYGLDGDDRIYGGGDGDDLYGNYGNDDLFGEDGSDKLWGGYDNDDLFGGESIDYLIGGEGDDLLVGGEGGDHLTGGSGLDDFAFAWSDNTNSYDGHDSNVFNPDTIWDFTSAIRSFCRGDGILVHRNTTMRRARSTLAPVTMLRESTPTPNSTPAVVSALRSRTCS